MVVKRNGAFKSLAGILMASVALTGCAKISDIKGNLLPQAETYASTSPDQAPVEVTKASSEPAPKNLENIEVYGGNRSSIIEGLIARRTHIGGGSAFDQVSRAVLASDARTAESELRAARLRARAEQFNWLPKIGPNISLTSLGDLVTQLVVEQVVFDNGRLKAERDFAAHDVEAAAVGLSQATNQRVATALTLYVNAARARSEKSVAAKSRSQMGHFVNIIQQRVDGGVSNMADLRVAESKMQELNADHARANESELTAMAELSAMAQRDMGSVTGLGTLSPTAIGGRTPLNVLLARAEGERQIAQAQMDRAAMLPGITAGGTVGEGGTGIGVGVSSDALAGVGTGAALEAVTASKDAARRGVQQAEEDNRRTIQRLQQRRASLQRQQAESQALVSEAQTTYQLFYDQFENSGRPIMDVVNIFENAVRLERDSVRLKYQLMEIEIELSSLYGNLVNGGDV